MQKVQITDNAAIDVKCDVIVPFSDRFLHRKISLIHRLKQFIYKPLRKSLPTILINNSNWYLGDVFRTYPDGNGLYLLYIEKHDENGVLYRYYEL